jgi:hypothetical protein
MIDQIFNNPNNVAFEVGGLLFLRGCRWLIHTSGVTHYYHPRYAQLPFMTTFP